MNSWLSGVAGFYLTAELGALVRQLTDMVDSRPITSADAQVLVGVVAM